MRLPRRCGDDGSYALETAILAPVMFAVIALMIAFGRIGVAGSSVDSAARAAARAASLDLTGAEAQADAAQAARQSLSGDGVPCARVQVSIDTAGLAAPLGQAATVSATVACTVRLSDVGLPGLPGSKTLTSQFASPVDPYRSRGTS